MKERQETCEVTNLHINLPKNQQKKSLNTGPKPKSRRECLPTTVFSPAICKLCYNRVVITASGKFVRNILEPSRDGTWLIASCKLFVSNNHIVADP